MKFSMRTRWNRATNRDWIYFFLFLHHFQSTQKQTPIHSHTLSPVLVLGLLVCGVGVFAFISFDWGTELIGVPLPAALIGKVARWDGASGFAVTPLSPVCTLYSAVP